MVPAEERDEQLGDRLRLEADHVLTWLVSGYQDWREHGFGEPERVTSATAAYRADSDALGRLLADRCITGPDSHVRSSELPMTRVTGDGYDGLSAQYARTWKAKLETRHTRHRLPESDGYDGSRG